MAIRLKKQQTIDSWESLIENAQGQAPRFFAAVEKDLREANLPGVSFETVEVVTSEVVGWFGSGRRDYLLVTNKSLSAFKMYINARDYGNYLSVTWVLLVQPGFFTRRISKFATGSALGTSMMGLDLFMQQELSAYTGVVHRAVSDTVKALYAELNQDFSVVNMRSRSGLAAW